MATGRCPAARADPHDPCQEAHLNAQNPQQNGTQPLGRILSVRGSQASLGISQAMLADGGQARITVGRFVGVQSGASLLIGVITEISFQTVPVAREEGYGATAQLDLMGEIKPDDKGTARFHRGVTDYPAIGDRAMLMTAAELQLVYSASSSRTAEIGHLHQDSAVGACIDVDGMLSKHFAVLGSTGVGKSSGVAVILREVLMRRPDLRVFLIDPHNEYGRCFGDQAEVLNPRNLRLPFWLFNFEEIVEVLFGGRQGVEHEIEILADLIPVAKSSYVHQRSALKKFDQRNIGFTADTPVPYRLADLIALIDDRMGKLENRSTRMQYHKLITRIETVRNDPRYAFMFENANVGGDTMADVLTQLFRLPPTQKPITVMQLAGFPAEVVDSVVSVLCRMAFDFGLWSDGAYPLLFVCEEAHRYAPADHSVGFISTRRAVSRIAKEGRKYRVFLGLVTQRPAELDPTILSQCSTLFALRMVNDRDQALLRSAVSDAAANLTDFVPSLGTREALAFGEGVPLPVRLKFKSLPTHLVPRSEALGKARTDGADSDFIASVLERWRGATMSGKPGDLVPESAPAASAAPTAVPTAAPPIQPPQQPGLYTPPGARPPSPGYPGSAYLRERT
jgi:DNA helicase HerA-like ATPase